MLALLVAATVVLGIPTLVAVGCLRSPTYVPPPEQAWARRAVAVALLVPAAMLVASSATTWYVVVRLGEEEVREGRSGLAMATVALGLASGALAVRAAYGHRNWAPLTLPGAWLLLGLAWFEATPLFVMDPAEFSSTVEGGLVLVTAAMALMTGVSAAGLVVRWWGRPWPPPPPPPRQGPWERLVDG